MIDKLELEMNDSSRLILALMFILIVSLLFWKLQGGSERKFLREINQECFGVVNNKEIDKQNHGSRVLYIEGVRGFDVYEQVYNIADIGDSISKKKGDLKFYIYKKDGRVLFFDYERYYKNLWPEEYEEFQRKYSE